MKPVNLSSIEKFVERVKLAEKSHQRTVALELKDAVYLKETLEHLILRLLEKNLNAVGTDTGVQSVNADGGKF